MSKIIKFSRVGCTPCKIMTNYLHDKGTDYQELDVEEDAQLATKYGIASVPSLLLIDENGKILERVVGFNPEGIDYLVSRQ